MPVGDAREEFVAELTAQQGRLAAFVRTVVPNAEAAKDVLQETNLVLWQKAVEFQAGIRLPEFKVETDYKLTETLPRMGMRDAFKPFGGADLTGMYDSTGLSPDELLHISDVFHKAFVEVNEKGTEAAATAVVMGEAESAIEAPFIPTFTADRPFIYLIREKSTRRVLFLGRMTDPTESK